MKAGWVECWHPDSPGLRVAVWRPWWRRKTRPFATHREMRSAWWRMVPFTDRWEPRGAFYDATRAAADPRGGAR